MSHGPSTFGSMMTSSLLPTARDDLGDVVEHPGRVERVDARPQPGRAEIDRLRHLDEARARGLLGVDRNRVLEIAEHHVDLPASSGTLARTFSMCGGTKWIMRSSRTGSSRSGAGAPIASG